jgi:hypothetical protein
MLSAVFHNNYREKVQVSVGNRLPYTNCTLKKGECTLETIKYGEVEINRLLNNVRTYHAAIGAYEQHLILPDDGAYSIKLTNGTLRLYAEELMDEQTAFPQERLKEIAARFRQKNIALSR